MSTKQSHDAHRERAEKAALEHIAERLTKQFPELPVEQITHTIQGRYDQFADSRIRDFVPVLVERSVKADLTHG